MIEAVNAVASNAQMIRAVAEQTSSAQSFASNPTRVQTAAVTAPYLSPHVDLNGGASKPIFVVRDSETGDHIRQFPTEGQIRAYQRAKDAQARVESQVAASSERAARQESADLVESSVQYRQQRQEVKVQQQQSLPGSSAGGEAKQVSTAGSSTQTSTPTSVDTKA